MIQNPLDEQKIELLTNLKPRRCKLSSDWTEPLHPPGEWGGDWRLVLPFRETFYNTFVSMTDLKHKDYDSKGGRLCLFLPGADEDNQIRVQALAWANKVGKYVAIRDGLALSFALDFEREGGNPDKLQTEVGRLRARAKPYDKRPTADTQVAASLLVRKCVEFLGDIDCYGLADSVVAMPGSSPIKSFDLPAYLAKGIATTSGRDDLSSYVRTVKKRQSLKSARFDQKLDTIRGTIETKEGIFNDRVVLLVDDLYQSGISLNYCAMLLLNAGARMVLGLTCEKTCRNDDNMGGGLGQ